jgi:hypothetical protein
VNCDRIDAALDQLVGFGGVSSYRERTRGRPSTRWVVVEAQEQDDNEGSFADGEEPADREEGT